eukprot:COSAG02_NODE_1555_length_11948_cov_28.444932_3_plen_94_part_00
MNQFVPNHQLVASTVLYAADRRSGRHQNRPFPGTKLDVPRLAAPRGPARGGARANRSGLSPTARARVCDERVCLCTMRVHRDSMVCFCVCVLM